jgi:hypothetical protein
MRFPVLAGVLAVPLTVLGPRQLTSAQVNGLGDLGTADSLVTKAQWANWVCDCRCQRWRIRPSRICVRARQWCWKYERPALLKKTYVWGARCRR